MFIHREVVVERYVRRVEQERLVRLVRIGDPKKNPYYNSIINKIMELKYIILIES